MFAYVGCRTTRERNARGRGISLYRIAGDGSWRLEQRLEGLTNPSYLALNRDRTRLYAVHGDGGEASAFAVDARTGHLGLINTRPCGGRNPVHLVLDHTGRFLLVANFATGTLGAIELTGEGALGPLADVANVPGAPGPYQGQQKGSHPHHIPYDPSGRFLIVPDKGCDQISLYRFDPASGRFARHGGVRAKTASAPRHSAAHPAKPLVYCANELDSTLTTYAWDSDAGALTPLHRLSCLPASFCGDNTAAGIVIASDGGTLYLSNRGHDSIAVFRLDAGSGLPAPVQFISTGGGEPRFITLDPEGKTLYVGNENSDSITRFEVDPTDGTLSPAGQPITTESPTCIVFAS